MRTGRLNGARVKTGYDEQHQINLRGIYSIGKTADVGVSIQYGLLKAAEGMDDDGANHYALSAHMKNVFSDFTLYSQFSYYAHNIADETPWGTGDLIPMGGYDFAWPIASKGLVPGLSLRYGGIDASGISWVNSVTPYLEWSFHHEIGGQLQQQYAGHVGRKLDGLGCTVCV